MDMTAYADNAKLILQNNGQTMNVNLWLESEDLFHLSFGAGSGRVEVEKPSISFDITRSQLRSLAVYLLNEAD